MAEVPALIPPREALISQQLMDQSNFMRFPYSSEEVAAPWMNTMLRRMKQERAILLYGHQGPDPGCHSPALGDNTLAMPSPVGAKTSMGRVSKIPAFERVARGTVSVSTHLKL